MAIQCSLQLHTVEISGVNVPLGIVLVYGQQKERGRIRVSFRRGSSKKIRKPSTRLPWPWGTLSQMHGVVRGTSMVSLTAASSEV